MESTDIRDTSTITGTVGEIITEELTKLDIDIEKLLLNFVHKTIKVGGEVIHKKLRQTNIFLFK